MSVFVLFAITFVFIHIGNSETSESEKELSDIPEEELTIGILSTDSMTQVKTEANNTISTNTETTDAIDLSKDNEEVTLVTSEWIFDSDKDTTQITTSEIQEEIIELETTLTATEHEHTYVMTSSCMYHPEEGHYEQVCISEGYHEEIYEYYDKYCYYCGAVMDDWGFDEILDHSSMHGAYGTHRQLVDSVWHEPIYEQVWVVDLEAYYEEEVVVECIECGYIERSKYYGD